MCCFVIFTDLNFVNNYFNVFQNIEYILDPYLFSDFIKRQLALSNYNEIEINLFIVSFPYTIIPWKRNYNA